MTLFSEPVSIRTIKGFFWILLLWRFLSWNVVTGLISKISNAFRSVVRPSFASDDRKSTGSSTGVTDSKVIVGLSLTIFLEL